MYIYNVEDSYKNKEVLSLYKLYYPEIATYIVRRSNGKKLNYFVVVRYEGQPVGAMGISELDNNEFGLSITVVHPDHRRKNIATNLIALGFKFCFEKGAVIVHEAKSDNDFPHDIFNALGFKLIRTIGRNKQQNKDRIRKGLPAKDVRYIYQCRKKDVKWKELNRVCKNIKSGE